MLPEFGWQGKQLVFIVTLFSPGRELFIVQFQRQTSEPDNFAGPECQAHDIRHIAGTKTSADCELDGVVEFLGLPLLFEEIYRQWRKSAFRSSAAAALAADQLAENSTASGFNWQALLNGF